MKRKPKAASDETRVLFVRIDREQHRQLRLIALNRDVRLADVVRDALAAYLKSHRKEG